MLKRKVLGIQGNVQKMDVTEKKEEGSKRTMVHSEIIQRMAWWFST
jgi:hypothetical protein